MVNYFEKANKIRKEKGCRRLFLISLSRLLPKKYIKQVVIYNGISVIVEQKKYLFTILKDYPLIEEGVAAAHRELTQAGDNVVIIGGGYGVTAILASSIVGKDGSVTVFEGGDRSCKNIRESLKMNNVSDICTIHHAMVGKDIDVYGGNTKNAKHVSPVDLPDCDILELDCEGAETDILKNMLITPRIIIVEIHPWFFDEHPEWVTDELERRGYKIIYRSGHDGIKIDQKEYNELLHLSNTLKKSDLQSVVTKKRNPKRKIRIECGARIPAVVAATYVLPPKQ